MVTAGSIALLVRYMLAKKRGSPVCMVTAVSIAVVCMAYYTVRFAKVRVKNVALAKQDALVTARLTDIAHAPHDHNDDGDLEGDRWVMQWFGVGETLFFHRGSGRTTGGVSEVSICRLDASGPVSGS
jgi:hypothetical protein